MYRDDEFYVILDKLRFDMYYASFKSRWDSYKRVIVKIFGKDEERIIVETIDGIDEIIYDTRMNNEDDLLTYDLLFLKVMERIVCSLELPNRIYEYIDGVGAWSRIKFLEFNPTDEDLKMFFEKVRTLDNEKALSFGNVVKDEVFSKPEEVKKLFEKMM